MKTKYIAKLKHLKGNMRQEIMISVNQKSLLDKI